jgi:hypothetical protein
VAKKQQQQQKNATHVKLLFSITQEQSKQKKLYTQTVNKAKEKEQLNGWWVVGEKEVVGVSKRGRVSKREAKKMVKM